MDRSRYTQASHPISGSFGQYAKRVIRQISHVACIIASAVALSATLASTSAQADSFSLRQAEAVYRVSVNGVPTGIEATVRLTPDQSAATDTFELHFFIKSLLIKLDEKSTFDWQGCYARPRHYSHEFKGLGIRRNSTLDFNWDTMQADVATPQAHTFELTDGTLDSLAMAMTARCELSTNKQQLEYDVADTKGMQTIRFQVEGRERITTPAGTFDTLRIARVYPKKDRTTLMWSAPALDYFMVRMDHIESPIVRGRVELKTLDFTSPSPAVIPAALPAPGATGSATAAAVSP